MRKNNLKLSQDKDEIIDKDRDKIMKMAQKKLNELDRSRINKLEKLIDMVTAFTLHEKQNVFENILAGKKVSTFKLFIEYKEMVTDLSKVVKLT